MPAMRTCRQRNGVAEIELKYAAMKNWGGWQPDRLPPELLQSRMMRRSFSAGSGWSNHLAEYSSAISFRTLQEGGLAPIVYLFFLHAFILRSQGQAEGIANHVNTSYSGVAGK